MKNKECKHRWHKGNFVDKDIFGKIKNISWEVCGKCGVIRKIKPIEEVKK